LGVLYLVRHGQAGTRENYDSLSPLGQRQARLFGEFFAARNIRFETAYSGSLARQSATAELVRAAMGHAMPDITVDPGWDEFDLDKVYSEMAPHLSAADAVFRREYEEMQRALEANRDAHDAPIHRRWNDCDKKVVRAWIEERYPYRGESWRAFGERIRAALTRIASAAREGNAVVFTSATPIAISAASTLGIFDLRVMQIAAVLLNTSVTLLRMNGTETRLFSLNATPHLSEPSLQTFR
jgi:broad specificity phosphatase PhoE